VKEGDRERVRKVEGEEEQLGQEKERGGRGRKIIRGEGGRKKEEKVPSY